MSESAEARAIPLRARLHRLMSGRDRTELHRAATPLELLFDLCFVVAVSQAAKELTHGIASAHTAPALLGYLMVFFAIWWAWLQFSWFASAYDTDDVLYRVLTLVQMAGVLILAAGVPSAFQDYDFRIVVVGYVVMRLALVGQWLRCASEHPEGRATALRYALGVGVVQVGWILRLFLPEPWSGLSFLVLVIAEISVPVWAERKRPTPWHPEHIAERYGLFTIIVLGECILAATVAIQSAGHHGGISGSLLLLAFGGLLLVFGLWWLYFARPAADALRRSQRSAFVWGYGHYFLFAAIAALGSGLEVAAETLEHATKVGSLTASYAVAVPVVLYLLVTGFLQARYEREWALMIRTVVASLLLLAVALVGGSSLPLAVVLMGLVVGVLVAVNVVVHRAPDVSTSHPSPDAPTSNP